MKHSLQFVIITLLSLPLAMVSGPTLASDDAGQFTLQFDTSKLNPTPKSIRSATIRALLDLKWNIVSIEKSRITADYKDVGIILSIIEDKTIDLKMSVKDGGRANPRWLEYLKTGVLRELQFDFYVHEINNM